MDRYLVALYAHFLFLVAAVCTATIVHFMASRARSAETVRDARSAVALVAAIGGVYRTYVVFLIAMIFGTVAAKLLPREIHHA